ncbi:VOC family protein [Streptococcus loxodontisalivarius]|uniref:Lactoylglutathione lyase n=1 Tax=Streptococcus loxodontisalivarius TaxID=1349415 RepID=A0ABS2PSK1_9STRE|nr:VOC family protein [Streptococcus loxodontisalivarius]MBM7643018.1 lactoylglutathione lyase [Streptococcus loxodontisalivarius]
MTVKIEHVGLWVKDLEGMRRFYESYFQVESSALYHNPKTGFSSYFLTFEGEARLELCHRPDVQAEQEISLGFAHLALSLGSKEAVDDKAEQLVAAGFSLINGPRTTGDGYYEAVVLDPEGNQLELTI